MSREKPFDAETNRMLMPGKYRHYKGGEYTVLGVARHSETDEQLVVYRPNDGEQSLWVRPLTMFCESVEIDGMPQPRFKFLGPSE